MTNRIASRYAALVADGHIAADPAQQEACRRLDTLSEHLGARGFARKSSALGWLFARREPVEAPRGLYIWGSVGRGKTMLMDLFFDDLPITAKRRVHFHAFMADVHERIHAWRQRAKTGSVKGSEPIASVAEALAQDAQVLCFDEFSVNDIADAMILGRLFEALFRHGVVIVATSNVAPDDLYAGGLNRTLFLPFIALLKQRADILKLDAAMDYRLDKLAGTPVYRVPADAQARAALDEAFLRLSNSAEGKPMRLTVKGRAVPVPHAAQGVARFAFADLCEAPLGAEDYLEIARNFHTVLIDGIPVLDHPQRNIAKRFITLIDVFYDLKVKLIASADAEPLELYRAASGREAFEFERTVSRLIEMRSEDYLALPHGQEGPRDAGNTEGLVET